MPKTKTVTVRNQSTEEAPPLIPLSDVPQKEKDAYWLELVNDLPTLRETIKPVPFFALLNEFPTAMWEKHLMIYMYRLDPEVRNRAGEKKYIQRVTWPIDEEWVKEKHGGGKYELYLKCGDENLKQIIFSIDGQPILLKGQTLVNGENSAGAQVSGVGAPGRSDVAEAIRATSEASSAGFEIMKTGMKSVLEMVAEQKPGQPPSSSNQIDELLKLATALKALQPAPPPENPLVAKLLELALANLSATKPNPETTQQDLGGQLSLVKEMFDVDSLRDLGDIIKGKTPKADATPWYVPLIAAALEKAPQLLSQISEMQQQNFQRALTAHMMQNGLQPQPGVVIPPSRAGQVPPPTTDRRMARQVTTQAETTVEQPPQNGAAKTLQDVITTIASGYDRGFEGWQVAAAVDFQFPGVMEDLKPMLGDPVALAQFVAGVPILAERSTKDEWPAFQEDFVDYVKDNYGPEQSASTSDATKAVAAPGAA